MPSRCTSLEPARKGALIHAILPRSGGRDHPLLGHQFRSKRRYFRSREAFVRRLLRRRTLVYLFASAIVALTSGDAFSAPRHKQVIAHRSKTSKAEHHKKRPVTEAKQAERAPGPRTILTTDTLDTSPLPQLSPDLVTVKQALQLLQQRKLSDATKLAVSIGDSAARKLIAWAALRDPDNPAGFDDYNSFIQANPDWPIPLLRRRAEARLWQERRDAATVRRFVGAHPASAPGRLALARLLLNDGDRTAAASEVQVWYGTRPNYRQSWKPRLPLHSTTN